MKRFTLITISVSVLVSAALLLALVRPSIQQPDVQEVFAMDMAEPLFEKALQASATSTGPMEYVIISPTGTHSYAPNTIWRKRFLAEPILHFGEISAHIPVLMYHKIEKQKPQNSRVSRLMTVSPAHFEKQMQELVDLGYTTITPTQVELALKGGILPKKPIVITFDDGHRSQYTYAYPILRRLGLRATFFIVTNYIDRPAYMTRRMIQDMQDAGVATIGSHTIDHHGLNDLSLVRQQSELADSKKILEDMFGKPVTTFAYPYGIHNAEVITQTKAAGYASAYSCYLGTTQGALSKYELRRIRVNDGEPMKELLDYFEKN